jgi:hypothetical protein
MIHALDRNQFPIMTHVLDRNLFVFSNERQQGFFEPLAEKYALYTWRNFTSVLEGAGLVQNGTVSNLLLLYLVQQSVAQRAKRRMETFNHLTEYFKDSGCCAAKPDPTVPQEATPMAYILEQAG